MSFVQDYIDALSESLKELLKQDIAGIADVIFNAYKKGNQIFIMGNGGSAATSSHFAEDLRLGRAVEGKPHVRATSLTDNTALITALANDLDYASIFAEQMADQLNKGDIVIGISASGNSPNVLKAIEYGRSQGAITIGFCGFGGGKLKDITHRSIVLSSSQYGQVEDAHLCLAHIVSHLVRQKIAERERIN
jgi:D-sedoheptulose 7-phosphate isomerase